MNTQNPGMAPSILVLADKWTSPPLFEAAVKSLLSTALHGQSMTVLYSGFSPVERPSSVLFQEVSSLSEGVNNVLKSSSLPVLLTSAHGYFLPGWQTPLLLPHPVSVVPVSNVIAAFHVGHAVVNESLTLGTLRSIEPQLYQALDQFQKNSKGYRAFPLWYTPSLLLPSEVWKAVGEVEEYDSFFFCIRDYLIRLALKGYPPLVAHKSLVLELSPDERERHSEQDKEKFVTAWGDPVLQVSLGKLSPPPSFTTQQQEFSSVSIAPTVSLSAPKEKLVSFSTPPRVGAVYCVYEDWRWLEASVSSIYDAVEKIFFLIGEKPWNGLSTDNSKTIETITQLPDPLGKITLHRGSWETEGEERNYGLSLVEEAGLEYLLIIDADEIYVPQELQQILSYASLRRYIQGWRAGMITYWKSPLYKIDPPEYYQPLILVKTFSGRFTEKREMSSILWEGLPRTVGVLHHLSYARTDEEVLRKITTFSHISEMVPDWYEKVWKEWDKNPALHNLNPCWPEVYRNAVPQPFDQLPEPLQKLLTKQKENPV